MGVKDWSPKGSTPPDEGSPRARSPREELLRWLEAGPFVGGGGEIDLGERGPVYIGIVIDPVSHDLDSTIVVAQSPDLNLETQVIQAAFLLMRDHTLKNESYMRELQDEWGDGWKEALTKIFDGAGWTFNNPAEAASVLQAFPGILEYIDINDPRPEE